MTGVELAKQGLCGTCHRKLARPPWTDDEIADTTADIGISPDEFEDWCDDCFVQLVCGGDAREAARLLDRPVQLRDAGHFFRALLS